MAPNPNPARITNAMWWLWEALNEYEEDISSDKPDDLLLGGIYADKTGYHNTRNSNPATNYSVRDAVDKRGPGDKAAALDLTFKSAQSGNYRTIAIYSKRLYSARTDRKLRLYLREYYGNNDSDTTVEGWDFRYQKNVTSDKTHLWHIHLSVTREYADDMDAMRYIYYVLTGRRAGTMLVRYGDGAANGKEEDVKYYQRRLARLGFNPGPFDGEYGDNTQKAVTASRAKYGYGNPGAKEITGTHAERMDDEVTKKEALATLAQSKKYVEDTIKKALENIPNTPLPDSITIDLPDTIVVPISPADDPE